MAVGPGRTRRWLAAAATLATVVPLFLLRFPTGGGVTSGTIGASGWSGSFQSPVGVWSPAEAVGVIVALLGGAALVWAARDRRLVLTGVVITFLGVGTLAGIMVWGGPGPSRVLRPAQYRALRLGAADSLVRDRLGPPWGAGSVSRGDRTLSCTIYQASTPTTFSPGPSGIPDPELTGIPASNYAFCFAGGRLTLKLAQ